MSLMEIYYCYRYNINGFNLRWTVANEQAQITTSSR